MPKRKARIQHAAIVERFAAKLRELRSSRGLTQAELTRSANVTVSYIWKLESRGAAPGIDLVDRLTRALGTVLTDLLPPERMPDTAAFLRNQTKKIFDGLLPVADRETLLMLNPLLAKLNESLARKK